MNRRQLTLFLTLMGLVPGASFASGKKAEGGEGKGEKKPQGTFLMIGLATSAIVRSNGRHSVLSVETGIDVPDPKLYARAEKLTPRLQAAYVQAVQIYAASLSPTAVPDADYISRELQRQTDLVVGARGVRLLLGSIIVN